MASSEMFLKSSTSPVQDLLRNAVKVLCQGAVQYQEKMTIQALMCITVDGSDVLLVDIRETIERSNDSLVRAAPAAVVVPNSSTQSSHDPIKKLFSFAPSITLNTATSLGIKNCCSSSVTSNNMSNCLPSTDLKAYFYSGTGPTVRYDTLKDSQQMIISRINKQIDVKQEQAQDDNEVITLDDYVDVKPNVGGLAANSDSVDLERYIDEVEDYCAGDEDYETVEGATNDGYFYDETAQQYDEDPGTGASTDCDASQMATAGFKTDNIGEQHSQIFATTWIHSRSPGASAMSKKRRKQLGSIKRPAIVLPKIVPSTMAVYDTRCVGGSYDVSNTADTLANQSTAVGVSAAEVIKMYTCLICNKEIRHLSSFLRHRKQHDGTVYRCDICGTVVNRRDSLVAHKKRCVVRAEQQQQQFYGLQQ